MHTPILTAPFPWFGGKRRAASIVWQRLGNCRTYIEPFAGSLAVLLGRPSFQGSEVINDLDCYVANFWRALQTDPQAVAWLSDYPVNEADLIARHRWLVTQEAFRDRIRTDPDWCDFKVAAWWVWGIAQWIGSGFCDLQQTIPSKKLPHMVGGSGVHRLSLANKTGGARLEDWFQALGTRLRHVRVACGDWTRVLSDASLSESPTGILLDPPYSSELHGVTYSAGDDDVADQVREWAIAHGDRPNLRIALCGYAGEHQMPATWSEVPWKAAGGYGNRSDGRGRANAERERIWFSPHCLRIDSRDLFSDF
jgi:DNA adenine methylase